MSIEAISWVIKQDIPDGVAKLVAMVLADYADRHTGEAHPKIRQLAEACSQSERSVQRKLRVLQDLDVITIQLGHCPKSGRQRANSYILHLPGVDVPGRDERFTRGDQAGAGSAQPSPRGDFGAPHISGEGCPSVTGEGDNAVTGEGDSPVTPIENPSDSTVRKESSDPDGSAPVPSAAVRDFRKELFGRGVQALRQHTGRPEVRCRTLIGAWLKLADDDAATVLRALDAAIEAEVIELVSWVEARLKRKPAVGLPAAPNLIASRRAEAARMAQRGEWPLGGEIFVAADSPEGQAWERYFAGFGQRPKWMSVRGGLGWNMPSAMPPTGDARASA